MPITFKPCWAVAESSTGALESVSKLKLDGIWTTKVSYIGELKDPTYDFAAAKTIKNRTGGGWRSGGG